MITWFVLAFVSVGVLGLATLEFAPSTQIARFVDRQISRTTRPNIANFNRMECLTSADVALIEKILPNLRSVVVLCNKIDDPNVEFKKAVLDNFSEGVSYSFFVSKANSSKPQLDRYRDTFLHLHAASLPVESTDPKASKASPCISFSDFFSIGVLPLDWQNVPYIFYVFGKKDHAAVTIAFKGTEPGVGISSSYVKVEETEARAILDLCRVASNELESAFVDEELEIVEIIPWNTEPNVVNMYPALRNRS
jgi:hypothetical protein